MRQADSDHSIKTLLAEVEGQFSRLESLRERLAEAERQLAQWGPIEERLAAAVEAATTLELQKEKQDEYDRHYNGWQALDRDFQRLKAEVRRSLQAVGRLPARARESLVRFDFWYAHRAGVPLLARFDQHVVPLLPEDELDDAMSVADAEVVYPFLAGVRGLLLEALSGAESTTSRVGCKCSAGDKLKARLPRSVLAQRDPDGAVARTGAGVGETPDGKDYFSVQEVAQQWGLSDDKVRDLFAKEPGVMVLGHNGGRGKQPYKTVRIPKGVVERVKRRMTNV